MYEEIQEKRKRGYIDKNKNKTDNEHFFKKHHPKTDEKYFLIEQAAEMLKISPSTLRNMDKNGIFKAKRHSEIFGSSYKSFITGQERNLRLYSEKDIWKIKEIRKQKGRKQKGCFSISEVAKTIASIKRINEKSAIKWLKRNDKKIKPLRNRNNSRCYSKKHIKIIKKILSPGSS